MKKNIVILLLIALGIGVSWALRQVWPSGKNVGAAVPAVNEKPQANEEEERRKMAWRIVAPQMEKAQAEALDALHKRAKEVEDFFTERQAKLPAYAERVLSLKSKWELAWTKLPTADKEGHKKFLKAEFSSLVFSEADLSSTIKGATENYVRDITAIENALLTKVRADIQDFPECGSLLTAIKSDELFQARFSTTVDQLSGKTGTDMGSDIGRMVASEIATAIAIQVAQAIATRLGVSAGIIGTGAALGPETFGVTVLAGLVVDQAVGWVVGWFYDPVADITQMMRTQLSEMSSLIVHGDSKTETRGLIQEWTTLAQQRHQLRERALQQMILTP